MFISILKKVTMIILLISLIAGCETNEKASTSNKQDSNESAAKKELKIAVPGQSTIFDSHINNDNAASMISRNVFETLLTLDKNYNVQPMLAESWKQSDDGKTMTFKLREGVHFHNGKELKAEDVAASLERWFKVSLPGKRDFTGATAKADGDYTVVVTLPAPSPFALSELARGSTSYPAIMPKEIIDNAGVDGVKEYIGTGPFKFAEIKQDQYVHLTKFKDYKSLDAAPNGLSGKREALVDDLYFMTVPDTNTRESGVQSGEYDIAVNVNYDSAKRLNSMPGIRTDNHVYGLLSLYYNKRQGLFKDVKAREAISNAIDRKGILQGTFGNENFYQLNTNIMLGTQLGKWPNNGDGQQNKQPNPDKAKQLLKDAGYKGEELTILATKGLDYLYNASVVLQQQLQAIGVNVKLDVLDYSTYLTVRYNPDKWDILVGVNQPAINPAASDFFNKNFVGWTESPEFDKIAADFKAASSIEEVTKSSYGDLNKWFNEYIPVTRLGDVKVVYASKDSVGKYDYFEGPIFWNVSKK